jgi:hypothetical protein
VPEYLRKVWLGLEPDFLEAIPVMCEALMEAKVSQKAGAERYARSETRTTYHVPAEGPWLQPWG